MAKLTVVIDNNILKNNKLSKFDIVPDNPFDFQKFYGYETEK